MGERLFQKLKPVCVDLVRAPSSAVLGSLLAILQEADNESLQPLQQYVLLPLRIILKGDVQRSSDIKEGSLDAIRAVFTHTEVTSFEVFSDFFVILTLLISSGPKEISAGHKSEELKQSATKCLTSLVAASNEEVLSSLYSLNFLPPLGHAVSILLSLVEEEQLRQLRLDAMQCLCQLMPESGSTKIVDMARSNFCSFLPGITMSLCRVIQGDPKQGQNVTKTAIATWVKAVAWVMSDDVPPEESDGGGSDVRVPPTVKDPSSLVVKRTSEWLESTSKKLNILIGQICKQKTNSSWQVRLGLVHFATKLLIHCKRNLSDSNGSLLSLLVGYLADDWPDVATASLEGLKEFKKKHMDSDDRKLVEVLEENLYVTMTALPRQMRSSDDDQKLATLNLVQGYLTLLGPKINQMLKSSSHLHRFSMGLLQVLEFDVKDSALLEDASVLTHQDLASFSTPGRNLFNNFKTFSDDRILSTILRICNLLGYYGDLMLLVDHFLDVFRQSELHSKQACLVLNHILRGTLIVQPSDYLEEQEPASRDTLETIIEMIIEEYLSEPNWSLPTSVSHPETMTTSGSLLLPQEDVTMVMTLQQIQNNTVLTCLLLEGIAACATVIGPAFDQFLIRCLYPLLEKLAADKSVIRQIAFQTLHTTATLCGYSSIADLLSSNADYLVDAISSKLRHLSWNHHAPHVLRVTIEHCDANMLPLLEDTIEEILWSLDNHYVEEISSFVPLLQTIANAILKWFPPAECEKLDSTQESSSYSQRLTLDPENDPEAEKAKVTSIEEIQAFFLDHLKNKRLAEGDVRDEDLIDEEKSGVIEEDEDFNPEMKKDLPLHVKILIKILDRCKHHLANNNPRMRLKLLSTVQICVQALTNEKDQLLPAVHKLWPSLIPRFQDEEPLVVCMASDTLTTLSYSCGDFLRRRVGKDVLPKLICVLESSAATSGKAGPAYGHTAAHKLQLAVLNLVGPLCLQLDVAESELNNLICACLEYLSAKQPLALQEACRRTFTCFMELEPDSVWLLLNDVNQSEQLIPTNPDLSVVKFASNVRAKEFEQNCRILLHELNTITANSEVAKSGEG